MHGLDGELELSVQAPPGWVRLDLGEGFAAEEYALAVHRFLADEREAAGERVRPEVVEAAAATLAAVTRTAREHLRDRGGLAFAFVPHPEVPCPVWLDVLTRPEAEFTRWAEHRFSAALPAADPRAAVSTVDLPAGPARRVRAVLVPDDLEAPVAETLELLLRPDRTPGAVLLSARWAALGRGDEIAGLVDEFARTMQTRVVRSGGTAA